MSAKFNFYGTVGNVADNVQGNQEATLYISEQQKSLVEVAEEIQNLFDYLEQSNPTLIEVQRKVKQAVEHNSSLKDPNAIELAIKNSPTLQARLRNALTAASLEAIKVIFAPAGILIEAVRAWIYPS
ncbi:MAG: hypothetical protein KME28_01820 [Pelatocladus maniniholoensis HA4357-MV3]|uniref:Uncharacterized protein n=1 Tax=Pelatocladus maniniholoensis HA4357-MV3 TaxID=1117104 RepID=A0A9E3H3Y1_9NOST|nr:hypothetical protein [Pelatocladus maniniholoensis HA4357-MV3]